jgi:hypothetical protein
MRPGLFAFDDPDAGVDICARQEEPMNFLDKMLSRKVSRKEFAEIVIRAFAESGIDNLEFREAEFALKIPGKESTVFLHNSYSDFATAPRSERRAIIARLVASFTSIPEIPKNFAAAKASLMPVVRDAAYYSLSRLLTRKHKSEDTELEWQSEKFASGLVLGLAYDTEHSITSINQKLLTEWGVDIKEAFTAAKDNLWEKTDPSKMVGQNGVYMAEWHDSYDSSRMMLTELIYRLQVDGDPIAFVPNRDAFWVTGKDNLPGLRAVMKAGSESHFNLGHSLSPDLYVLVDGKWELYIPEDAELKSQWRLTRMRRDYLDYDQQKKLLDQIHEDTGEDYFVASYTVFERPDKTHQSICVWTRDVDSSLPKTDAIAFILDAESKDMFVVPWERAVEVVGGLLHEESELIPVRYRAREFPDKEQVKQLRQMGMRM